MVSRQLKVNRRRFKEEQREEALARASKKRAAGEDVEARVAPGESKAQASGERMSAQREPLDEYVVAALGAADDKKALDLVVLDVHEVASFTEYFLIAGGTNTRQVQAIADGVVERLKELKRRPARVEGYNGAEGVLLDEPQATTPSAVIARPLARRRRTAVCL